MALIECIECGAKISDKAISCPKCGCNEPFKTLEELENEKLQQEEIRQQKERYADYIAAFFALLCGIIVIFFPPRTYELDAESSAFMNIAWAVYIIPMSFFGSIYGLLIGLIFGFKKLKKRKYTESLLLEGDDSSLVISTLFILFLIAFVVHFFTFSSYLGGIFDYLLGFIGGLIFSFFIARIALVISLTIGCILRSPIFWLIIFGLSLLNWWYTQ